MLKNRILRELEMNRSCPISGQALAERYHVSRNAVWKAVNALKEEGYEILSAQNRGYKLAPDSDRLSREGILAHLEPGIGEPAVYAFRELDSTNNEAKRMLASGFRGRALVVSECQSAGRGRGDNRFYSPSGTGLYLTMLTAGGTLPEPPSFITIAAAVAVARAVESLCGLRLQFKWVNDLFLEGKKAGGILSEAVTDLESGRIEEAVVGVGLNVTTKDFPPDIRKRAISLGMKAGSRNRLAAEIAGQFFRMDLLEHDLYMDEYRERSLVLGRNVVYEGEAVYAEGLDELGGLIIRRADGRKETLRGGSITLEEESETCVFEE